MKARLFQVVEKALDRKHLRELVEGRRLAHDSMDVTRVRQIREDMERAEARRLQPHFIASFFLEAFTLLGGTIHEREPKRYEIKHVPAVIRNRDREIGRGEAVLPRYERITFEKDLISVAGKPLAAFVCPGHPLLDATLDLIIERTATCSSAARSSSTTPTRATSRGPCSTWNMRSRTPAPTAPATAGSSPSGCSSWRSMPKARPPTPGRPPISTTGRRRPRKPRPCSGCNPPTGCAATWKSRAMEYAAIHLVPEHLDEVRRRKEELIDKTKAAVQDRLTKEINYWDHRAAQLKDQELAGRVNAKLNSGLARQRADELTARLQKRLTELEQERKLSPLPPVVLGGALIVPAGLLRKLQGKDDHGPPTFALETERSERLAMNAVMDAERRLGYVPKDVSDQNLGYDIESADSRHRPAAVHRGQGPRPGCEDRDDHEERNPDRPEQARRLHPGNLPDRRRECGIALRSAAFRPGAGLRRHERQLRPERVAGAQHGMPMNHPKKLIEVALPLVEINDASAYDKMPGIGPHPKGIHHWWARLPLPTAGPSSSHRWWTTRRSTRIGFRRKRRRMRNAIGCSTSSAA